MTLMTQKESIAGVRVNEKVILIVEDDIEILEVYQALLESIQGVKGIFARDAQSAIEILQQKKGILSAVLCDYFMPDGNGTLVIQFNSICARLPFCLVSNGVPADYEDLKPVVFDGVRHFFLEKPVDASAFKNVILKMLNSGRP